MSPLETFERYDREPALGPGCAGLGLALVSWLTIIGAVQVVIWLVNAIGGLVR